MEDFTFITEEMQNKETLCKARRPLSALSRFHQISLYLSGTIFIACGIIYLFMWQIIVVGLLAIALGIFLYFASPLKRRQQFKQLRQYQNADEWQQRICFGDRIQVTSGKQTITFDYNQFGKLAETDDAFYLFMEKSSAMRIPKNAIVTGDCAAFPAFIQPRLGTLKSGSTDRYRIIMSVLYLGLSIFLLAFILLP